MTDSRDGNRDAADEAQGSLELIAIAAGVVDVPVFAYLGLLLWEDPLFGAFVGLVIGLGTYLSLPAIVAANGEQGSDEPPTTDTAQSLRGFHRTAAGLALPPAGILLLAWRFVSDTLLLGVLATAVVAAVIYVSLAVLLPDRRS